MTIEREQRLKAEIIPTPERIRQVLEEESRQPGAWWYLSYANEKQFLGALILESPGLAHAVLVANQLKLSPGGEVMGLPIPPDQLPPEPYRYRLLSVAEIRECWGDATNPTIMLPNKGDADVPQ